MPMSPRLLRPRATSGFDPRTIAGLALWLDARDPLTVLNSVEPDVAATVGQSVRRWSDKSGAGITADSDSGAQQPALQSAGEIAFDGSNDRLSLSVANLVTNVSYVAIFAAIKTGTVGSAVRPIVFFRNNAVAARTSFTIGSTGGFTVAGRRLDNDSFQSVSETTAPSSDTRYIVAGIANYGAATATVRRDGVETAAGAFQTAGSTSNTNSSESTVGAHVGGTTWWNGSIYELLIYNGTALTTDQVLAIERYLGRKWGIAVA